MFFYMPLFIAYNDPIPTQNIEPCTHALIFYFMEQGSWQYVLKGYLHLEIFTSVLCPDYC